MTQDFIQLLIVDDDPIVQLGLVAALKSFPDLQVIAQVDTYTSTLEILTQQLPDLLVLNANFGRSIAKKISLLQICCRIKKIYPALPILIFGIVANEEELAKLRNCGVNGYCPPGISIEELVSIFREVANGSFYWAVFSLQTANANPNLWHRWLAVASENGLQQIDASLLPIANTITQKDLSILDRLFWQGRRRELLVARWLVKRLLPPTPNINESTSLFKDLDIPIARIPSLPSDTTNLSGQDITPTRAINILDLVFNRTLAKIHLGLDNQTNLPLEIDILQPRKKEELLCSILERLQHIFEELQHLQVPQNTLVEKINLVLRELWQVCLQRFVTLNYSQKIDLEREEFWQFLLKDYSYIDNFFNKKVPFTADLFCYLLYQQPLTIDNVVYRVEAPESIDRAELILQNLVIEVANGVMQSILNNFYDLESIKYKLYKNKYFTSREIARFRNDISWQYWQEELFENPKNIFESQYNLLFFDGSIKKVSLYASRTQELEKLTGIGWAFTMALETRDAIAPRLRRVVSLLGNGLVYVLTQVIGKGIGLIGKGIVQGVGNTWQDNKYGNNRKGGR